MLEHSISPYSYDDTRVSGAFVVAKFCLAFAAIYALQVWPVTGIFMMMLAAPFWIGVLLHLMMLSLIALVASLRTSPLWILIPVAFYGYGFMLHLQSFSEAKALARNIEQSNAAAHYNIEQPFTYWNASGGSDDLLRFYRGPVSEVRGSASNLTLSTYAKGYECNSSKYSALPGLASARTEVTTLFSSAANRLNTDQCIVRTPVRSANWSYKLEQARKLSNTSLTQANIDKWTVFDPSNRELVSAQSGVIYTLPAIPFVIAGCALSGRGSDWSCTNGFSFAGPQVLAGYKRETDPAKKQTISSDPETWAITPLAKALNLQPRQAND